jgi:hypothetical protein
VREDIVEPLTLFSWGYWGWGNATARLIQAVDAVEAARGYKPPLFVDVRISRSVRALGFTGRAFEQTVGESRYRWLDALGNLGVQDGGTMRIKNPAAADTLLDIAEVSASGGQRILFFCSCEVPGVEENGCHRTTVARLALEAAARRRLHTQVVEWPGGEPRQENLHVQLSEDAFEKVRRGATSIPLEEPVSLAQMAAVPWYSVVAVSQKAQGKTPPFLLFTGPARYRKGGWYLPIYENIDPELSADDIRTHAQELRKRGGYEMRQAPG